MLHPQAIVSRADQSSLSPAVGLRRGGICSGPGLWALAAEIVGEACEGRVGEEVGVGCWEQLRNEPRTSTNILCALQLALEPPSAHPSSWHPLGPWLSSWGLGAARERPKADCQRGRDTAAGSSAGLLSV